MAGVKTLFLLLTASELIFLDRVLGKGKGQRQYNEQCVNYDASASCDSSKGLICIDAGLKGYRCLCPSNKLHAQTFDAKRNACVGKVLNACVRGSSKSTLNDTLCTTHAECNTEVYGMAVCLCKAGFTERDDGTCAPSLKHGDNCGNSDQDDASSTKLKTSKDNSVGEGQCDEKHGQTCIAGKCQCRFPSEQYYDEKEGKCISYAKGRCAHDGHVYSCVPNSNCPAPSIHSSGAVHSPIGLPLPPFLSAFASASASSNGEEIFVMPLRPRLPPPPPPPYRHPIHRHPHLHHHPYPKHDDPSMEFDTPFDNYDYGARSIFFGSSNEKDTMKGNGGAESAESADGDSNQPRCQCLPGFTPTASGFCMKGYGSKCNIDDGDDDMGNNSSNTTEKDRPRELCNADQFLECMDALDGSFTCQCRNQMNERYDPERKECVSMVGRRCRPLGNYPKCDKGSECVNGICQCSAGTTLTPMETCAKDYDKKCEPGQCNAWKGLMCHGKSRTCMCLDSYLRYDQKKRACVASKGSMCGSVKSASNWGNNFMSEMAYVDCEADTICQQREVGGKKMSSMCM